jgi:hypothetical protein
MSIPVRTSYGNANGIETTTHATRNSIGLVTAVREEENVCDIIFFDDNHKLRNVKNVEVELHTSHDNWFPKVGSLIKTKDSSDNRPIISGEFVEDWSKATKNLRQNNNNIMAANSTSVGGYITG